MPSPDVILSGLAAIANDWRGLAIGWHLWLAVLVGLFTGGWRPSVRTAGSLLVAPLVSVAVLAWFSGNPFNGLVIAAVAGALSVALLRISNDPVRFASAAWIAPGGALIVLGVTYPHFLQAEFPAVYLIAAPFGLLPCPTLAVVIGSTLTFANLRTRLWSMTLLLAGLLYGTIGVFRLGVQLDWALFVGVILLGAKVANDRTPWRAVRATRSEHVRALPGDDVIPARFPR
jgi:hypothetical protein